MPITVTICSMARNKKYYRRKFGELTIEYYHHLDLRPFPELDDEGFSYVIENVKGIDMLDLNETEITDKSIELLPRLEYVRELRLRDCHLVTDISVKHFSAIKELAFLYLKGTSVTFDGLLKTDTMPELRTLHFEADDQAGDFTEKMLQLRKKLPGCEFVVNSVFYSFLTENL